MKFIELKEKKEKELLETLKDLRGNLSRFNFQLSNNTLKNSSMIKKTKRDIARVMTVLNKEK
ncbi:MAG: 50S ribosomal protein L29 [bacterium]|nr:50S ribosomal protein L29 [bacterium]